MPSVVNVRKVIGFRPSEEAEQIIAIYMKEHKLSKSQALNQIIAAFHSTPEIHLASSKGELIEKLKDDKFGEPKIPCVYGVWNSETNLVECQRFLKTKQKIIEITLEGCKKCYKRKLYVQQQKQGQTSQSSLSAPKNIYCPELTNWVSEAQCQRCKQEHLSRWRACQELRKEEADSKVFQPKKEDV